MGGKRSTTTQQVTIPPEVMARYNAVNTRAETVAQNPFQIYSTDPSAFVAPLNQQQQVGIENINTTAGAYRPYFDTAMGAATAGMASAQPQGLDVERYMNPYQQQVIDATMRQMGQANEQAQSGALGQAVSSGAFGGDRAGIAAANLANQQGLAMGSTLAGLNAQNYSQALDTAQQQQGVSLGATQADLARLMQGGQFMAGLGTAAQQAGLQGAEAQINAGTLGQQTEQAGLSALYNQFMQQQAYPFQVAQFLANIAMGTGALSGSTTTATQPAPFFSDRRLKHDVRRIGHTDDGLPIYKFKYKGDPSEQTHVGFMADEVEKVKPEAVGVSGGYKTVDYDRATKANGGGVAGPYGSAVSSDSPYMAGYVPQAYLPVGDLMVADGALMDNAGRSMAEQLAAAARLGESAKELEGTWNWAKDKWGSDDRKAAAHEAEGARGVAYASGGAAYLNKPADAAQPVEKRTYLSDTLEAQEKDKDKKTLQTAGGTGAPQSGAGGLGSLLGGAGAAMSGFAAIAPFLGLSDRRAKHDIRRIGKTDHGMPIYSFKYKGDDREQTHIGFMADEVEDRHPQAVSTGPDGMKRVDYDQAHRFYQGGVVRSGYADGGVETAEERMRRLQAMEAGAATDMLPSGVVPKADRISAPVSYDVAAPDWRSTVAMTGASPRAYDYDPRTGMVRDPATGQYVTNSGTATRNELGGIDINRGAGLAAAQSEIAMQQMAERQAAESAANRAADMFRSSAEAASASGSSVPAAQQFPDLYARMNETRTAADAMAAEPLLTGVGYTAPSEVAMRAAPISAGLVPAAGTPFPQEAPAPTTGLVPAAGTPFSTEATGDLTMSTSQRPRQRPAGLGTAAAPVVSPTAPSAPAATAASTGVAGGAPQDASTFYRTRIIQQESGGRQFDENGNPLTSPKGAVGVGQVMEGTGPEAAALAGLEWDRDRWLHDPDYNAAIGEAYFLDQYRRFGSLDKAAAAYNAGPTALAQAMDRAAALGGSYLDYLPKETQNYVASVTGGSVPAGAPATAPERTGLAAGLLTPDRPYEDRNAVGKMFYNEDGSLNRNALLSLASGVGAMLSSPSQFFLPSLGLGMQGFASTYAGLEKQAADVGLTRAQEAQTRVATDVSRFFTVGPNGIPLVVLGPDRTVTLAEYLRNPQAFSTGDPRQDAAILAAAQERQRSGVSGTTGMGGAGMATPQNVRWTGQSQAAIQRAADMAVTRPDLYPVWQQQIAEAIPQYSQARSDAITGKPNVNELAYTVGNAIADGNMGSVEGYLAQSVVAPVNAVLRTLGVEGISNADDQATILKKLQALNGAALTPEQERAASVFQMFAEVSPDLRMTPAAASAITSAVMLQNQQVIDQANYYNAFLSQLPMGAPMSEVDAAYAQEYAQLHQQEKGELTKLFEMASDPIKGETVRKFLNAANAGTMPQEDAQRVLQYLLGENASPVLARYFVKGM